MAYKPFLHGVRSRKFQLWMGLLLTRNWDNWDALEFALNASCR